MARRKKKIVDFGTLAIYEDENFYYITDRNNENSIPKNSLLGEAITLLMGEKSVQ